MVFRSALISIVVLFSVAALLTLPVQTNAQSECGSYGILHRLDLYGVDDFWPGFNAHRIPLAIFDGTNTCLFRHPSPPPDFHLVNERATDRYVFAGRHESVTANSSVELNGIMTATLMVDGSDNKTQDEWAAIAAHEKFHVFQGERHPEWSANEANLFVYPTENTGLLALRILETEALRRALAGNEKTGASWAFAALQLRRERFAQMDEDFSAYERGTEMKEGLAQYIQFLVNPETDAGKITAEPFAADAVRLRAYATGLAMARLLDRFHPEWKDALEADDSQSLGSLLGAALENRGPAPVHFSEEEKIVASQKAASLVDDLMRKRAEKRKQFENQSGWTLILEVKDSNRLWPQGFDPVNVLRLSEVEILHSRFLRLGNGSGELEIMNHVSLTEGFGPHPLFNGTRKLTVKGLSSKPRIRTEGGTVIITGEGIRFDFRDVHDVSVQESEQSIHLALTNATEKEEER